MNKKLILSSDGMFESVQGEGVSMGKPAVFLRLQGCNLKCEWCDTKYTWVNDGEVAEFSIEQVLEKLHTFTARRLVITGGEPLLQMDLIEELLDRLDGWKVEIETNGTIKPSAKILDGCQLNVSPKLKNSGNDEKMRLKWEVLSYIKNGKEAYFKFVVGSADDLKEVDEIVKKLDIDQDRIIVMAEGIDSDEIKEKMLGLVGESIRRNWRLLPRLHVYLWGNKRKV